MTETPSEGLWLPLSELARTREITKAPLSRRISRLEAQGLIQTKPGPGGTKLINVAEFDKVTGETTDAVREANGRRAWQRASGPVLSREQARKTAYQADLAKLELEERLGNLLPVSEVQAASSALSETVIRVVERLPQFAEEVASVAGRDGVQGVRVILKRIASDQRTAIAAAALKLAKGAADAHAGRALAAEEGA